MTHVELLHAAGCEGTFTIGLIRFYQLTGQQHAKREVPLFPMDADIGPERRFREHDQAMLHDFDISTDSARY